MRSTFALSLLLTGVAASTTAGAEDRYPAPVVVSVKGYLFDTQSLEMGKLDAFEPGNERGNDVTSDAMLVVVGVRGRRGGLYDGREGPKYRVRLAAAQTDRPKFLSDKTIPMFMIPDSGIAYYRFIVYFDGCTSIRVAAYVVGPRAGKPVRADSYAHCGE